jgi:group I intron endonuclease
MYYDLTNKPLKPYGTLYMIINLFNNKKYIGQALEFERRVKAHKSRMKSNNSDKRNNAIYLAMRKYGWDNFKFILLGFCDTQEELDDAETETILLYRTYGSNGVVYDQIYGYNMVPEAQTTVGFKHTDESKQKMREKKKGKSLGKDNPNYGNKWTQEQRDNLSKQNKGKNLGKDNPNYGNRWTQEQRDNLSLKKQGTKCGKENTQYINLNINKIKEMLNQQLPIKEIALYFNVERRTILRRKKEKGNRK